MHKKPRLIGFLCEKKFFNLNMYIKNGEAGIIK